MAPPPAAGSPAYLRDFSLLKKYQSERSDKDCAISSHQMNPEFRLLFETETSPLSKAEVKSAESIGDEISKLVEKIAGGFKGKYRRVRPYDADASLDPCVRRPGGAKSYPSSHAAVAAAEACVLGVLFPEKEKALREYGLYLGNLRAIVGVHHPSDVEAGQTLGQSICERLLKDIDFQSEVEDFLMREKPWSK